MCSHLYTVALFLSYERANKARSLRTLCLCSADNALFTTATDYIASMTVAPNIQTFTITLSILGITDWLKLVNTRLHTQTDHP